MLSQTRLVTFADGIVMSEFSGVDELCVVLIWLGNELIEKIYPRRSTYCSCKSSVILSDFNKNFYISTNCSETPCAKFHEN